jgi:hypothetical protein
VAFQVEANGSHHLELRGAQLLVTEGETVFDGPLQVILKYLLRASLVFSLLWEGQLGLWFYLPYERLIFSLPLSI